MNDPDVERLYLFYRLDPVNRDNHTMNIIATNILTLDLIAVVFLCGTPAWASQNVFKA